MTIHYNDDLYVPPSDTEENGDSNFYIMETVNPEVFAPGQNEDENGDDLNEPEHEHNTDTGLYNSPPRPRIPEVMFQVFDTDSENDGNDTDESNLDTTSHDNETFTQKMKNYNRDTEHEHDFGEGWVWSNTDEIGASHGPFTGNSGLNIEPDSQSPFDYVKLFLPDSMLHHITTQTNLYANRKKVGKLFLFKYLLHAETDKRSKLSFDEKLFLDNMKLRPGYI